MPAFSFRVAPPAWLLLIAFLALPSVAGAQALVCGNPGSDPASSASGIVNTYYAGTTGTLAAGATSLALGNRDTRGASTTVAVGDVLMLIQMQDGTINSSNSSLYGGGSGSGAGTTGIANTGRYEFVRADAVSGGNVTFSPALSYSYTNANATAGAGQRRYQIVRVPQFTNVTLNGVTAPPWGRDGASTETGGVVVVDAAGTITLGSATVEGQAGRAVFVGGRGFRGAAGIGGSGPGTDIDWRAQDTGTFATTTHGGKGEGIAGTPRFLAIKTNNYGAAVTSANLLTLDAGGTGYPQGDRGRGAPGNAGGGGTEGSPAAFSNSRNAGGGGGGNHASGGLGGRPWNAPLNDTGGRGGAGYAGVLAFNRIFLGGGGGSGGTNNNTADPATYSNSGIGCATSAAARCSAGGAGGGMVILRARQVGGTGIIDARGAHAYNVLNDAAGGGGGGGTVVLHTIEGGSATINVSGGDGGNAWAGNNTGEANRHGPGGGGGGGFIAFAPAAMSLSANLSGGRPGHTTNGSTDSYGAFGLNGGLSTFQSPDVPGVVPGAQCFPDLRLAKSNGTSTLVNGPTTYALTVSNQGQAPTLGTVTVVDVLPAGISVPDGALVLGGAQAANWSCNASSNVVTCTSATAIAPAATSVFSFGATVSSADGSSLINLARVGGGGDQDQPTPTPATTSACTGNNTPAGCAADADTVQAPLLTLAKSDGTDEVVLGGTTTYQLLVANNGSLATSGTIGVRDVLPSGVTYTGASPFTSGGFSCTWTAGSNSLDCTRATAIAAGANATISLPVQVAAGAAGSLTNRARVGGGADPGKPALPSVADAQACPAPTPPATTFADPSNGCASDTNAALNVELRLEKDDGQVFMSINGSTTYQFIVRNVGAADSAGTILFRDVLPAPMNWPATLVKSGPDAAAWTCTRVSATVVSCQSATPIPAGAASQFSLLANVGAATSGNQYINRARIGGGGDTDLPASLNDAAVTTCTSNNSPLGCAIDLNTAQTGAQVRLSKSHPDPQNRAPGETFTVSLVVRNEGGAATSGTITMVDVLPAGISFVGPFTAPNSSCSNSGQVVTCTSNTALAAGATRTISFPVQVQAGIVAPVLNRAQVGGGGDPQNSAAPTAATAANCVMNGQPQFGCAVDPIPLTGDLQVTKTNNQVGVTSGETVTYVVTVTNVGAVAITGAVVHDSPSGQLNCPAGNPVTCSGAACPGGALTVGALVGGLTLGTLGTTPPGNAVSFSFDCQVP